MRKKSIALLSAGLLAATLAGCGSNAGSGGDQSVAEGSTNSTVANAATVGMDICVQCHDTNANNWLLSGHANNDITPELYEPDSRCGVCHNRTGDATNIANAFDGTEIVRNVIGCEACHGGGQLHFGTGPIPIPQPGVEQCSTCHGAFGEELFHSTSGGGNNVRRNITDTHLDNPETTDVIEGYVVKVEETTGCADCHAPHEFNLEKNNQWAESAHGGHIKVTKDATFEAELAALPDDASSEERAALLAAVKAAGATDATAPGWVHYDWDAENRQSCQRCHTATGAKNLMQARAAGDGASYDPANNDFSHLSGWSVAADGTVTSSGQNEMLYCWGCHSDVRSGALNNPGEITETYNNDDPDTTTVDETVAVTFPDVNGSNVCLSCHVGREIGAVISATVSEDGNERFINSHYLTAGVQLFAVGGYHYNGQNYQNVSFFAHENIGTDVEPGTGTNGPCVGCHMSPDASHKFLPVEKDPATNEITAITATVCAECHTGGFALTPAELNVERADYAASLEALKVALQTRGIFFAESYPYFFADADGSGVLEDTEINRDNGFTNWAAPFGVEFWQDTMGAAFNFNLLAHDPGGYAHNRFYVKALIWDAIDFLDDGLINGTTAATLPTLGLDAATLAEAQAYLGNSRPGDGARPPLP